MTAIETPSSATTASNAPQVKVLNSQREQAEAVIGTLLEGIEQAAPRSSIQNGQRLNIVA